MTRMWIGLLLCAAAAALDAGAAGKKFKETPGEVKVFELTNLERKNKDRKPLKLNPALSKIARAHSENMVKQGKLEHVLDKKTPLDRLHAAGYKFSTAGENVAFGDDGLPVETIMKLWMASKAHAANILQPAYTEIGIGIARDKSGALYYTQLFAKPR